EVEDELAGAVADALGDRLAAARVVGVVAERRQRVDGEAPRARRRVALGGEAIEVAARAGGVGGGEAGVERGPQLGGGAVVAGVVQRHAEEVVHLAVSRQRGDCAPQDRDRLGGAVGGHQRVGERELDLRHVGGDQLGGARSVEGGVEEAGGGG